MARHRIKSRKLFAGNNVKPIGFGQHKVTGINTGKVYPYGSTRQGFAPKPAGDELVLSKPPTRTVVVGASEKTS